MAKEEVIEWKRFMIAQPLWSKNGKIPNLIMQRVRRVEKERSVHNRISEQRFESGFEHMLD